MQTWNSHKEQIIEYMGYCLQAFWQCIDRILPDICLFIDNVLCVYWCKTASSCSTNLTKACRFFPYNILCQNQFQSTLFRGTISQYGIWKTEFIDPSLSYDIRMLRRTLCASTRHVSLPIKTRDSWYTNNVTPSMTNSARECNLIYIYVYWISSTLNIYFSYRDRLC